MQKYDQLSFQVSILSYRFLSLVLNIGKDTLNYMTFNNLEYDSLRFHIWGVSWPHFFETFIFIFVFSSNGDWPKASCFMHSRQVHIIELSLWLAIILSWEENEDGKKLWVFRNKVKQKVILARINIEEIFLGKTVRFSILLLFSLKRKTWTLSAKL